MTRQPVDLRPMQDGCALDVVTQPHASPYLLFKGQTCLQKADTLRLLRHERARGITLSRLKARNN
jgi:hypothetical protein